MDADDDLMLDELRADTGQEHDDHVGPIGQANERGYIDLLQNAWRPDPADLQLRRREPDARRLVRPEVRVVEGVLHQPPACRNGLERRCQLDRRERVPLQGLEQRQRRQDRHYRQHRHDDDAAP